MNKKTGVKFRGHPFAVTEPAAVIAVNETRSWYTRAMERKVYQARFDYDFESVTSQEVATVAHTDWPVVSPELPAHPPVPGGRFVRELADDERFAIREPNSAGRFLVDQVFIPFADFEQEELWALMLNTKNLLTHTAMIYRGSVNMVTVRMAEIFRSAVRVNATAMILGHNHPSGDPTPSPEDVQMTCSVNEAGQILGIELLDHMIVGNGSWVSLKERGLGFG